ISSGRIPFGTSLGFQVPSGQTNSTSAYHFPSSVPATGPGLAVRGLWNGSFLRSQERTDMAGSPSRLGPTVLPDACCRPSTAVSEVFRPPSHGPKEKKKKAELRKQAWLRPGGERNPPRPRRRRGGP